MIKMCVTKADFLANVSHEIRTPLNALMRFMNILKKDETDLQRQKYFDIINSFSQDLFSIIIDILNFSKIESEKLEIEHIPVDLSKPFRDVERLYFEKSIKLKLSINFEFPIHVLSDSVRIKQIVSNLISNAIKFTPKNKSIYINIGYKDGFLNVFVKDEGIGINKKNQDKIFNSFSQEVVELFEKNKYDVILMDENMPIMNGIEATKILNEILYKTKRTKC